VDRRAGDTEAMIGELYHSCYRRLVAQLYAFTADLTEAQDVVQEAFARALSRPGALADVDNPEAWLRTVAINVVRRRWRRRRVLDTILRRERPVQRLTEPGPEPDRADLAGALAAIGRTYREAIVLHYFADLPVAEIATILQVPAGTVKSRLSRGRAALAGHLAGYRADGSTTKRTGTAAGTGTGTGPGTAAGTAAGSAPGPGGPNRVAEVGGA
jgi:RNA polymerase sigma-70 factor (sigma-E family)